MILDCPVCHSRFLIPDAALGSAGRTVRCGRCRHQWFQTPDLSRELFPVEASAPKDSAAASAAGTAMGPTTGEARLTDALMGVIDHLEDQGHGSNPLPEGATRDEDGVVFYQRPPENDTPYDERLLPALRPPTPPSLWLRAAALAASFLAILALMAAHASWLNAHFPASLPVLRALGTAPGTGLMLAEARFEARDEPGSANFKRFVVDCTVRNLSTQPRALPNLRLQIYNRAGERMVEENHLLAPIATIAPGDDVPCDIPAPAMRPGTAETLVLDLGAPLELWQRASLY